MKKRLIKRLISLLIFCHFVFAKSLPIFDKINRNFVANFLQTITIKGRIIHRYRGKIKFIYPRQFLWNYCKSKTCYYTIFSDGIYVKMIDYDLQQVIIKKLNKNIRGLLSLFLIGDSDVATVSKIQFNGHIRYTFNIRRKNSLLKKIVIFVSVVDKRITDVSFVDRFNHLSKTHFYNFHSLKSSSLAVKYSSKYDVIRY